VTLRRVAGKTITCEREKGEGAYDRNANRLTGIVLECKECHGSNACLEQDRSRRKMVFNESPGKSAPRSAPGHDALKRGTRRASGGIFIEFECVGIESTCAQGGGRR